MDPALEQPEVGCVWSLGILRSSSEVICELGCKAVLTQLGRPSGLWEQRSVLCFDFLDPPPGLSLSPHIPFSLWIFPFPCFYWQAPLGRGWGGKLAMALFLATEHSRSQVS